MANKIKVDFKIPEKRFYWTMLKALVKQRDWESLEKFANSKKSPIGYQVYSKLLTYSHSLKSV